MKCEKENSVLVVRTRFLKNGAKNITEPCFRMARRAISAEDCREYKHDGRTISAEAYREYKHGDRCNSKLCEGITKSQRVAKRRGQQFPQFPFVSVIIIE